MRELLIGLTKYFAFYNGERLHLGLANRTPDAVCQSAEGGGAMIVDKYGAVVKAAHQNATKQHLDHPMRLSTDQIQAICQAATASFGEGAAVWLFGSRVDDHKRGGDIDLLVRPPPSATNQPFAKRIKMLGMLERLLGERKIDLVIEQPGDSRPIVTVAHTTGIQIQ